MLPELVAYHLTGERRERADERRHDGLARPRDRRLVGRPARRDRRRPGDPAGARAGGAPARQVARHPGAPRRGARHRVRLRGQPARRRRQRVRLGRDVAARRRRARPRPTRREAAQRGELHQRDRRAGRLPVPEERPRLLAARAMRGRFGTTSAAELLERAAAVSIAPVFDVHDERFLAPERMDDEVRLAAGLGPDAGEAIVARSIVESIAHAVGRVVGELRQWQPVSTTRRRRRRRCLASRPRPPRRARRRRGRRRRDRGDRTRERPRPGDRPGSLRPPRSRSALDRRYRELAFGLRRHGTGFPHPVSTFEPGQGHVRRDRESAGL